MVTLAKPLAKQAVRASRAGDIFHYRWAARRCLRMIDPSSTLECITIESSREPNLAGEYVIDLAEYSLDNHGKKVVAYYQLKHSSSRVRKEITFSEIKKTLVDFAKRYSALMHKKRFRHSSTFVLVTNRRINKLLKQKFDAIRSGKSIDSRFFNKLESATGLKGESLRMFCSTLVFTDGEVNYIAQKSKLRGELAKYLTDHVNEAVDKLIGLVTDRVLPDSNGKIFREDILNKFDIKSERDLFPAPCLIEKLDHPICREQHKDFVKHIIDLSAPIIIHAPGGVGKSVVARQIAASLPKGSLGVVYDCFGAGKYRNPSEPRHRPYDALVQMVNEMAAKDLCPLLIAHPGTPIDTLFREFIERASQTASALRKVHKDALLVLLIDAADNAEMVASDFNEKCFAGALLREEMPLGCRIIELCRSERIDLLQPASNVHQLALRPFSQNETAVHLKNSYPNASDHDVLEFHRLTSGNPRVQANALFAHRKNLVRVLESLEPAGTTVSDQIAAQLRSAIDKIKDRNTKHFNVQVEAICRGLANLPPFVPLEVLAKAANVKTSTIKSFVSDLGRPLWQSDDAVQFRDEPTETWFRENFAAKSSQILEYTLSIEQLASHSTYAAKALPQLLHRAGNYKRLIQLALSDDGLPQDNPIDERDVRVYRLQFAFKAALKAKRLADAARIAFRAGEEAAGDKRQLELLGQNIDLIAPLQDSHRVQELAYRQLLNCGWRGSENIYSAALLSSVKDFHGEARGYLRSANRWLNILFEERSRQKDKHGYQGDLLKESHIVEFAWTHLNLFEPADLVQYVKTWTPPQVILNVMRVIIRRLVDAARYDEINQIAQYGSSNAYLMIAMADVLMTVGKTPPKAGMRRALDLLSNAKTRIEKPQSLPHDDTVTPALLSFAEACTALDLSRKKIHTLLEYYLLPVLNHSVISNFSEHPRRLFVKTTALRFALSGNFEPEVKSLLPEKKLETAKGFFSASEEQEFVHLIGGLLPWYIQRVRLLMKDRVASNTTFEDISKSLKTSGSGYYRAHNRLPFEVCRAQFDILIWKTEVTRRELKKFSSNIVNITDPKFALKDQLDAAYAAFRLSHLKPLRSILETSCKNFVEGMRSETPEERSAWFIHLARAVLPSSRPDAAAYFAQAVESVSKFGDEMVDRWEAVSSVAKQVATTNAGDSHIAYRYVRCAEMIGENVAREKYWDRDDVFRIAIRLDPNSAFSTLSRWRDRDVGWFQEQLETLATEAIEAKAIPPLSAWCLSGFEGCNSSVKFVELCIVNEASPAARQRMVDNAINDFELAGAKVDALKSLKNVIQKNGLNSDRLSDIIKSSKADDSVQNNGQLPRRKTSTNAKPEPSSFKKLFRRIDPLNSNDLNAAVEAFDKMDFPKDANFFWQRVIKKVKIGNEKQFLESLTAAKAIDYYDIRTVISMIQRQWHNKAAVKRYWPLFLTNVGKRHATSFVSRDSFRYWLQACPMDNASVESIKSGAIMGLGELAELSSAGTFFGFVSSISNQLSKADATSLLDFSLKRFEMHIDDEYADGPWAQWLTPPANIDDAFTGLIWAGLGSPQSAVRWQAAHCVKRLVENGCEQEIASLIKWMLKREVGAFGGVKLPFYELHARMYLLIAFARSAIENSLILRKHSKVFMKIALDSIPHALIQKFAVEIALSIEKQYPDTYSRAQIIRLHAAISSPFPVKVVERFSYERDSSWNHLTEGVSWHFAWDFDHYWFNQFQHVFGVSEKQVADLTREAIIQQLKIADVGVIREDPRQNQWRRHAHGFTGTSHSHGSYPHIDDFSFYYSYHGFLSVAARLLHEMPVLRAQDQSAEEDNWIEWLRRHSLTRDDGRWLADRRDPTPLFRHTWPNHSDEAQWLGTMDSEDFLEILRKRTSLPSSLCIHGSWTDCHQELMEVVSITSALVNSNTSRSLASALQYCNGPHRFRLPGYLMSDMESSVPPFEMNGWIHSGKGSDKGLDAFDPYANEINYPVDEIGKTVADKLELVSDIERRSWRTRGSGQIELLNEVWSEKKVERRERPLKSGERICASANILKKLCKIFERDLVINVRIERKRHHSYYSGSQKDERDIPPSHKIFIFSADGIFQDANRSHKLR